MKIGFDPVPIGVHYGNSTYTTELIKALGRVAPQDDYLVPTYFEKGGALRKYFGRMDCIKILPILPNPMMFGKPLKKRLAALGRFIERKKAIASYGLYHCTSPVLFNDCCAKTVLTVHDLIPLLDEPTWASSHERNYYKTAIAGLLRKSSAIIADSGSTRASIIERFGWCAEKVRIIPLAAGSQFAPMQPDRSLLRNYGMADGEKPFLISVGVFSERKNIPFFLDAFAALPKNIRDSVTILLTGYRKKNRPYPQILDCIARNRLEKSVRIVPNIPQHDLVALYNMACCLVFPSLYEGFGLPVLEAMACGCPVIASSATSLPEVAGNAAVYIDPRDQDSLRDALEKVIGDEGLRKKLSVEGRARAGEFSWERTATMTRAVYDQVLN